MGIRPQASLVFGIHNYDGDPPDCELISKITLDDWILFGNDVATLEENFFLPYGEGLNNIIGLEIDSIGDKDTLRAIMFCIPDVFFTDGNLNDGWREFPLANSPRLYRQRMQEEIPDNQMYANAMCDMVPHWRKVAMQGLEALGITADIDKLKLMLVWQWC